MPNTTGNVLLIDDEDNLRHTLTRVLRSAGCQVSGAADGLEALQMLTHTPFDLVYLDIHLPGLNGLEVLQAIRKTHPELPVILLTGRASLQSAMEAIRLGASDYLIKPINPEELVARTRVLLDAQRIERRKREIREQIAALREELRALEARGGAEPVGAATPLESGDRFLKRGIFLLDLEAQRATFDGRLLPLPPTAFLYLTILIRHAPNPVDYQTLVSEAQGYASEVSEASELAKYHIHVLRQALRANDGEAGAILNVRGIGYRILTG